MNLTLKQLGALINYYLPKIMANLLCLLIFSFSDIFATFNKKYSIYWICFKDAAVIRDICASFIIINYYIREKEKIYE